MIKKLICKIWGHAVIKKAATGETMQVTQVLTGAPIIVQLTALVRLPFCTRCGEKIYDETLNYPRVNPEGK